MRQAYDYWKNQPGNSPIGVLGAKPRRRGSRAEAPPVPRQRDPSHSRSAATSGREGESPRPTSPGASRGDREPPTGGWPEPDPSPVVPSALGAAPVNQQTSTARLLMDRSRFKRVSRPETGDNTRNTVGRTDLALGAPSGARLLSTQTPREEPTPCVVSASKSDFQGSRQAKNKIADRQPPFAQQTTLSSNLFTSPHIPANAWAATGVTQKHSHFYEERFFHFFTSCGRLAFQPGPGGSLHFPCSRIECSQKRTAGIPRPGKKPGKVVGSQEAAGKFAPLNNPKGFWPHREPTEIFSRSEAWEGCWQSGGGGQICPAEQSKGLLASQRANRDILAVRSLGRLLAVRRRRANLPR